jgi:ribose transport system permease protein
MAGRVNAVAPQAGDGYELDVIAAVVIGGTSLSGGQGRLVGSIIGALIMGVVRNGLNLLAIDSNWQRVVIGSIIVAAVTIDVLLKRRRSRAKCKVESGKWKVQSSECRVQRRVR